MPSSGEAPIQDLAFDPQRTPKSWSSRRLLYSSSTNNNNNINDHGSEDASSVESTSSSASARRRFFPSNFFGGSRRNISHNLGATTSPAPTPAPTTSRPKKKNGGTRSDAIVIRSLKVFDVKMPPAKKHMVKNHLVPSVRGAAGRLFIQKHRRITIEVHGPPVYSFDSSSHVSTISAMTPMKSGKMQEFLRGGKPELDSDAPLQDNDAVFIRILKLSNDRDDSQSPSAHGDGDDEDWSVSTLGQYAPDDHDESFVEHHSYQLEDVDIVRAHGRTCEMKFGSGAETLIRDVKFQAEKEALLFEACLADVKRRVQERARRKAAKYREKRLLQTTPTTSPDRSIKVEHKSAISTTPTPPTRDKLDVLEEGDAEIRLLVDIVSAIDLPAADFLSTTDSYVTVRLGPKEVHRTKVVHKSRHPIWTVESQSLYLLELSSEEFFSSTAGLTFLVKNSDALGRHDIVGRVVVSQDELLRGKGERTEYDFVPEKAFRKKTTQRDSRLVLRFKEANEDDVEFIRCLNAQAGSIGIYADETFLAPRPPDSKLLKRMTRILGHEELYRVKHFPDPDDVEGTKWLSRQDLEAEALKDSKAWVEAGSGKLGKLYVEIIGCDGLPNMDANLNPRDKTDAFVCLVYEDVVVNTDVIGDTMKPRWMPWSCRAFVFNVAHPQSNLFLGVFDYDTATSHDPIGRVTINLGRFNPNTLFSINLPLYLLDEDVTAGKSRGTISLRLQLEWDDPRKAAIAAATPPPTMYVSCSKRSNWKVAHFTAGGTMNNAFSMNILSKYVAELQGYQKLTPYVVDAALNLLLWRGCYPVKICGRSVSLPIHSMTAFAWGLLISWNFNFLPSFLVFLVGWVFLAMNQRMRQNPSPWHRPYSFWDMFSFVLFQRKMSLSIKSNQDIEEFRRYMAEVETKRVKFEKERELFQAYDKQLREELSDEIATSQAEEVTIHTKKAHLTNNLRPLRLILYPVQVFLAKVVRNLRILVSVLKWDEPFFAMWITVACFATSFLMIWIPWGFLIQWTFRVAVFVFLGPWMALYDRSFVQKKNQTPEEQEEAIKQRVKQRYIQVREGATHNRTRTERSIKLKSMKKYLYGKYLVNVPCFGVDGYPSIPLLESTATPFKCKEHEEIEILDRKYGQQLSGDMIPTREFQIACLKHERSKDKPVESTRFPRLAKLWTQSAQSREKEPLLGNSGESGTSNGYFALSRTANTPSNDT